jgi:hypothetical protein
VWIIDIARRIQKELKNNYNYDYPIEIIKTSIESNNVGSFIFSTKKMEELGFIPDYSGKEIRSLLEQCKIKQQLVVH